jgi:hypothetical protein
MRPPLTPWPKDRNPAEGKYLEQRLAQCAA